VSLVEQLTQVMKQNSAVVMLALQREYSPTCSQSNFSSAVASDKQSECILKNLQWIFGKSELPLENLQCIFGEWINICKFATNFWEERIIVQKITWIEAIGIAQLRRKISEILFQTKLPWKATEIQEFRRKSHALLLHSTYQRLVLKRQSFINFLCNFLLIYFQLLFKPRTWFQNQSFHKIVIFTRM